MSERRKIDISEFVPSTAVRLSISYQVLPVGGTALVYRFKGDLTPAVLKGPGGHLSIELAVPAIEVELLDGTQACKITALRYEEFIAVLTDDDVGFSSDLKSNLASNSPR
jgi:hypothetical protein